MFLFYFNILLKHKTCFDVFFQIPKYIFITTMV